jgi:SGNH hydrolase-like domain, acetyltransferase AlgX
MNKLFLPGFLALLASSQAAETSAILKKKLESTQSIAIEGVEGWRFLPAEIKHLLAGDPSQDPKKPLEAIVDFHEQLRKLNVRLILVPVPAKAVIHPEFLDSQLQADGIPEPEPDFYASLRDKGVEVLDLAQEFATAKANGPLYCARDTHWNGSAIALAARELAEMLQGISLGTLPLDAREDILEIQGDLGGEKEKVHLRTVHPKGQTGRVEPDRGSPILVLGDSHVLVFHDGGDMHAAGAGLPDQLALELSAPVDVLGVRGSGATSARVSLARRARADSNYLTGKKTVIWCFAARELTQADAWKLVPLMKVQEPSQ